MRKRFLLIPYKKTKGTESDFLWECTLEPPQEMQTGQTLPLVSPDASLFLQYPVNTNPWDSVCWLRFPFYLLVIILLFVSAESPVLPLLEKGKQHLNQIYTRNDIQDIFYGLEKHYKKEGRYPAENEFETWLWETYRDKFSLRIPLDRWGTPLIYLTTQDRDGFRLASCGKDGIADTKDDFGIEVAFSQPRPEPPAYQDLYKFFTFIFSKK